MATSTYPICEATLPGQLGQGSQRPGTPDDLSGLARTPGMSLRQVHRENITSVPRLQGRGEGVTAGLQCHHQLPSPLPSIGFCLWELPEQEAGPGTRVCPTRPWSKRAAPGGGSCSELVVSDLELATSPVVVRGSGSPGGIQEWRELNSDDSA